MSAGTSARVFPGAGPEAGPAPDQVADAVGRGRWPTREYRVRLRPWRPKDEDEFVELARGSLDLHQPWISAPTTSAAYQSYLRRFRRTTAEGRLVCRRDTDGIVGFVNLNEVVLGPYRRGLIGYGAFTPSAGQGYMTEGLQLMIDHLLDDLRLHRLEADIQPANQRSIRLVQRLGFVREGLSPGFICINGRWMDHERWALTEDPAGPHPSDGHLPSG